MKKYKHGKQKYNLKNKYNLRFADTSGEVFSLHIKDKPEITENEKGIINIADLSEHKLPVWIKEIRKWKIIQKTKGHIENEDYNGPAEFWDFVRKKI